VKIRYDLEGWAPRHDRFKNFVVSRCTNQPTPSIVTSAYFLYRFGFEQTLPRPSEHYSASGDFKTDPSGRV